MLTRIALVRIGRCDMEITEVGLRVFDFSADLETVESGRSVANQNVIGQVRGRD